ncbi:MAG: 50S ribosomal protein L21 [Bacteroidota bacterium]|jgi:large subunit ribosomal protein L21
MIAIVNIQGQQFKISPQQKVYVHRLQANEGDVLELDSVMLLEDQNQVRIGQPYLADTKVKIKVLNHLKGDKVLVFKKKRRKGYQKMNGHRQSFSKILVESIG